MEIEFIPFMLLTILLATASFFDVAFRIIPNWVCGAIVALGFVANEALLGTSGIASSFAGLGLGLAMFLPFYMMRVMGAGDVKLMAAVGTYLGPTLTLNAIVWSALIGGLLGLLFVALRVAPVLVPALLRYTHPTDERHKFVPYGVAIAAGAILCQFQPIIHATLFD